MAWNEPGGGNRDPWGGGNRNGGTPPDLDEMLRKAKKKFDQFFEGGKGSSSTGSPSSSGGSRGLISLLAVVLFAVWAWQGIHVLDEKENGVVLRFGEFHKTIGPGLNWNPWLIDTVFVELVTEERQYATSGLMLTRDENIVQVPITVQYNIASIQDFVLKVNDPVSTLEQAADSAIRHVVGSTNLNDALGEGREVLRNEVKFRLQSYLDNYGAGINVIDVTLQKAEPPEAVKDAFDDVNAAEADKDRLIDQAEAYRNGLLPAARGQAQRMLEDANAYKGQVVERAKGEALRFKELLSQYQLAPGVTRDRLYIDAMENMLSRSSKVMVDVESGNNLIYLPLDKLMTGSSNNAAPVSQDGTIPSPNMATLPNNDPTSALRGGR